MIKSATICYVAGRSGGHLLPALTLARNEKQAQPDNRILFFSTDTQLDAAIVHSRSDIDYYVPLALDNVPTRMWGYPFFLFAGLKAFAKSFYFLFKYKPQRVTSMGGYISLPVCLAAWLLRIPVDVFELNVQLGKATQFLIPFAHTVMCCFEQTATCVPAHKYKWVPYPIRFDKSVLGVSHEQALARCGLANDKRTLCVVGGSQGSLFVNELIKKWLAATPHLHPHLQVIHQTGAQENFDWQALYKQYGIPAVVFDYHEQMENFYQAADLVICRSGSGTLHEILFFQKQCITIPLQTNSNTHQVDNARAMAQNYPAQFCVVYQKECADAATFDLISSTLMGSVQPHAQMKQEATSI